MYKNILHFIANFFSTKKVNPLKLSLNCCDLTVGKNELKFSFLRESLDLFRAYGVNIVEKSNVKKTTNILTIKRKFVIVIFFTPEVHKINNSLSSLFLLIKIIKVIKNEKGINLGIIPNIFNNEYLK